MSAAALILLAAALGVPVPADGDAAVVKDDLRFAENLARLRFFDLAFEVTADTARRLGDDAELAGEASLVEARIYKRKSESTADPAARREAQSAAIERLRDWRPPSPFGYLDRLVDALQDLADVLRERGRLSANRFLANAEEEARALAEEDSREAEAVYDELHRECEDRVDQFESLEQADAAASMRDRALLTWYYRGLNSIEWARVSTDPVFRLEQAIEQLDEYLWDASDEQVGYLAAQLEQGRAYFMLSKHEDDPEAAASLVGDARELVQVNIIEQAGPYFWDPLAQYGPEAQRLVASVYDRSWGFLAQLESGAGNLTAAQAWIDRLISAHDEQGIPIWREGHAVLLEWARQLDALGRSNDATEIAKRVAEEGRGTPEGQEAETLLAELVRGGRRIESPSVLMAVARGHMGQGAFADAAFNAERAAAALDTPGSDPAMRLEAWNLAAQALRRQRRFLESALAFEQAMSLAQDQGADLAVIEAIATGLHAGYESRFKETQDPFDRELRDKASAMLLSIPGLELDLAFLQATQAFADVSPGDGTAYLAVLAQFQAVPAESPNYERALVYQARALVGAGRTDEALAAFQRMHTRAEDASLEPTTATARSKREIALAEAIYYHAQLLLSDGVARPDDALAVLKGMEEKTPSQDAFHPLAKYQRVLAHTLRGDVDAAEQALDVLAESGAADTHVATAAFRVAQALEQAARALQASGPDADAEAARDLLRRAATAMQIYNVKSGYASSVNLLTTGDWFLEAGEPEQAQAVFEKALDVFGGKADPAQLARARMGLASAFDEQKNFGRARPLWKELYAGNPTSPSIRRGAAHSFGGWLEYDAQGNIVEVPGSGDYGDAFTIWRDLQLASAVNNKYFAIWWESKLGTIYTLYRQRELNSENGQMARKLLDNLKLTTPDFDEGTMKLIPEEQHYDTLYKPFFRYLDRVVPAAR